MIDFMSTALTTQMEYNNFLKREKLTKLMQEGTDKLNSAIRIKETEFI